jgi:hypothetical protein
MTTEEWAKAELQRHFDVLRASWLEYFTQTRLYLQKLDGETSRALGRAVLDIVNDGPSKHDWLDTRVALFLHNDPELWHELANSRKA